MHLRSADTVAGTLSPSSQAAPDAPEASDASDAPEASDAPDTSDTSDAPETSDARVTCPSILQSPAPPRQLARPRPSRHLARPFRAPSGPHLIPPLTRVQVANLRHIFATPPATSELAGGILSTTKHLLSVQAQYSEAALLALWNRLPVRLQSSATRHVLTPLALDSPPLARFWAQRCALQLAATADWSILSGACSRRVRAIRATAAKKWKHVWGATLAAAETDLRNVLNTQTVTTPDITAAVDRAVEKLSPSDRKLVRFEFREILRYTLAVLLTLDGFARRVLGGDHRRVALRKDTLPETVDEQHAMVACAQRYFKAYAPATERDFRYWMGATAAASRDAVGMLAESGWLVGVQTEVGDMLVPRDRLELLARRNEIGGVFLLGKFDPVLLAHEDKTWVVDERFRKCIWSKPGDVASCVMVGGKAWGTWSRGKMGIQIRMFDGADEACFDEVREKAEAVRDGFFAERCDIGIHVARRGAAESIPAKRKKQECPAVREMLFAERGGERGEVVRHVEKRSTVEGNPTKRSKQECPHSAGQ